MRIQLTGGRIIDPANDIDREQDLFIADGQILSVGRKPQDFHADQVIDVSGKVVCPGLVDLRARLREPGQENKGSIESETKAAIKGGITSLCCPPDTQPTIDSPAVVELIHRRTEQTGCAKVYPLGALTLDLKGEKLSEMYALKQAGCVGVSNLMQPVNSRILRRAMEYAASHGLTVYIHPQDATLSAGGCVHEGRVSTRLGLTGIPEAAETMAIAQSLQLIELTGVDTHFCQISTASGAAMIARAQYEGLPVTADVTAHHLFLTDMDIGFFNAQCHVLPPLRSERDRNGLRDALVNGTVSAICSDHQPHDIDAKLAPFAATEPGISGLETLLPLALRLVEEELLSLPEAIARVTLFPANILGIPAGTLDKGSRADICVFDPQRYWQLSKMNISSFGKNSPFLGWDFKGLVTHTLVDGKLVYEVDELLMLPIPHVETRVKSVEAGSEDQDQATELQSTQAATLTSTDDDDDLLDLMDGEEHWNDTREAGSEDATQGEAFAPFVIIDDDDEAETVPDTATQSPMSAVPLEAVTIAAKAPESATEVELPTIEHSANPSVETQVVELPLEVEQSPEPRYQSDSQSAASIAELVTEISQPPASAMPQSEPAQSAVPPRPVVQESSVTAAEKPSLIVDSFMKPKLEEQRSKIESLISSAAKAMSESGHLEYPRDTQGTALSQDREPNPAEDRSENSSDNLQDKEPR